VIDREPLQEIYRQFDMPGVNSKDIELLFNTSNFDYFCNQVRNLRIGRCPFCDVNSRENEIIPIDNPSWVLLRNKIAPRGGQLGQFVIPFKLRHVESFSEITSKEKADFWDLYDEVSRRLREKHGITGCAVVFRDGEEFFHVGSVRHKHINLHVPSGLEKVQVTLGKTLKSRLEKLTSLRVFKKMFLLLEEGNTEPWKMLQPEELALVKDDIVPPVPAIPLEI
jgi:diadenosine tetraphosphate (Ap4A) HIT family hydrolase